MPENIDKRLDSHIVRVKVKGDYACFTRPDLKAERMSYPCMTPAAARGILDSILWKPEFKWWVRRILVLNKVQFVTIKRNEIDKKQSENPIIIEENSRVQRNSVVLKDVAYIIEASIYQDEPDAKNPPKKYTEMFERRVSKGQCFRRPYLGTREFDLEFFPVTGKEEGAKETVAIGSLFFDMHYDEKGIPGPIFCYGMKILNGVLELPEEENRRLMASSHRRPERKDGMKELLKFYADQEEAEHDL